jgi:hypothetical protein
VQEDGNRGYYSSDGLYVLRTTPIRAAFNAPDGQALYLYPNLETRPPLPGQAEAGGDTALDGQLGRDIMAIFNSSLTADQKLIAIEHRVAVGATGVASRIRTQEEIAASTGLGEKRVSMACAELHAAAVIQIEKTYTGYDTGTPRTHHSYMLLRLPNAGEAITPVSYRVREQQRKTRCADCNSPNLVRIVHTVCRDCGSVQDANVQDDNVMSRIAESAAIENVSIERGEWPMSTLRDSGMSQIAESAVRDTDESQPVQAADMQIEYALCTLAAARQEAVCITLDGEHLRVSRHVSADLAAMIRRYKPAIVSALRAETLYPSWRQ